MADYWRQLDIVRPEDLALYPVTMIGLGGIGSPTALYLAKMGVRDLILYDDDEVSEHNLPNSMLPKLAFSQESTVGAHKVDVVHGILLDWTEPKVLTSVVKVTDQVLSGIVISGVDSMQSRKDIWTVVKRERKLIPLYIDARMGGETGIVYTVVPSNEEHVAWYEAEALFSDEEAAPLPCSAQAIIYGTTAIASLIASQVAKFVSRREYPNWMLIDMATPKLTTFHLSQRETRRKKEENNVDSK